MNNNNWTTNEYERFTTGTRVIVSEYRVGTIVKLGTENKGVYVRFDDAPQDPPSYIPFSHTQIRALPNFDDVDVTDDVDETDVANAPDMMHRETWEAFRNTGLLWFINTILHLFGWAIVYEYEQQPYPKLTAVYPARVKYRGFDSDHATKGYQKVSEYLKANINDLCEESYQD